jgi:hypothetical protein
MVNLPLDTFISNVDVSSTCRRTKHATFYVLDIKDEGTGYEACDEL